MKLHAYGSYSEYRDIQERGNLKKIGLTWVREQDVQFLAEYIQSRVTPKFGLCHGTRNGKEQAWFSKYLGCHVLGTEISKTATEFANTLRWDFHEVKPEWIDAVDFIYSNSFDHSYDPKKALDAWMSCTRLCIIEHTRHHGEKHVSDMDPFGAELADMPHLIATWGGRRYDAVDMLKRDGRNFIVVAR